MTTPNPTVEEKKRILAGYFADGEHFGPEEAFEMFMDGCKGYNEMTDDEVEAEWEETFADTHPDELEEIINKYAP